MLIFGNIINKGVSQREDLAVAQSCSSVSHPQIWILEQPWKQKLETQIPRKNKVYQRLDTILSQLDPDF